MKNLKKLVAFTLSEVLISLVIIGIIAAITVPTLIQRYQDQALKSALKKNYSVLKSALDKYQVDNGERLLPSDVKRFQLKSILMKYLKATKDCYNSFSASVCTSNPYKTYNNHAMWTSMFDDGQFVLQDGTFVLLQNENGEVSADRQNNYISVDVNGYAKKPNRLGRDLFMFQLMSNGDLLPMGTKGTDYYSETDEYCSNTSASNMNGAACTAKVLRD
jgi:prepilin-type N-terminal cleavage/methylation domain-containing protein